MDLPALSTHGLTKHFGPVVALQDLDRPHEAIEVYEKALELDPRLADAHFNLAGIYEKLGRMKAVIRYLKNYTKLIG